MIKILGTIRLIPLFMTAIVQPLGSMNHEEREYLRIILRWPAYRSQRSNTTMREHNIPSWTMSWEAIDEKGIMSLLRFITKAATLGKDSPAILAIYQLDQAKVRKNCSRLPNKIL
jgi:hypothetical protein